MNPNEILTRAADKLEQMAFGLGAEEFWQKDIARADLSVGAREWAPVMGPAIAKPLVALLQESARRAESGGWINDPVIASSLTFARLILGTCGAVREETGVRCSEPDGHDGFHKGKSVDDHGGPVFSRWSNTKTTPTSTRQDLADLRAKLAAPRTEPKWNVGGPIIPQPEAAVYVHQETDHG